MKYFYLHYIKHENYWMDALLLLFFCRQKQGFPLPVFVQFIYLN